MVNSPSFILFIHNILTTLVISSGSRDFLKTKSNSSFLKTLFGKYKVPNKILFRLSSLITSFFSSKFLQYKNLASLKSNLSMYLIYSVMSNLCGLEYNSYIPIILPILILIEEESHE